jgi:hypothetical protein
MDLLTYGWERELRCRHDNEVEAEREEEVATEDASTE